MKKLHVTRITNSTLTWLCRDWSHSRSPQDNLLKTICPMDILSLSFGPFCQQARVTFSQNFNYLKEGRHLSTNSCTQWYRPCLTETRSSIKRRLVSSEYHLQDPFCVIFTKFASRCLLPGRQIFTLWKEGYSNFDKANGSTTKKIKTIICLSGVIKIQRLKFSHALPRLLRKKAQTQVRF